VKQAVMVFVASQGPTGASSAAAAATPDSEGAAAAAGRRHLETRVRVLETRFARCELVTWLAPLPARDVCGQSLPAARMDLCNCAGEWHDCLTMLRLRKENAAMASKCGESQNRLVNRRSAVCCTMYRAPCHCGKNIINFGFPCSNIAFRSGILLPQWGGRLSSPDEAGGGPWA
jgi:hypothetical protein